MKEYRRGDLVFDVRDAGPRAGEAVALLHGFPQNASSWDDVAPLLNAAGYRTLAPDQRGYSPRARPRGRAAYRLDELVADVAALADEAGLDRFHLAGHDWGAAVAWAFAGRHPERLLTLTALSVPHPAAFRRAILTSATQAPASSYMAFFQLPFVPERVLLADAGARWTDLLVRSGLRRDRAERFVAHLSEPGALTAALNWYRAIRPFGGRGFEAVTVPTLLIWGTRDVAVRRPGIDLASRYVEGPFRLEILEGASHWLPEESSGEVSSLLVDHLRAHRGHA